MFFSHLLFRFVIGRLQYYLIQALLILMFRHNLLRVWTCAVCLVTLMEYDTQLNLKVLDIVDFYVTHGIDWLYPNHAILNCQNSFTNSNTKLS